MAFCCVESPPSCWKSDEGSGSAIESGRYNESGGVSTCAVAGDPHMRKAATARNRQYAVGRDALRTTGPSGVRVNRLPILLYVVQY